MSFRKLQDSLVEVIRDRVRNGEITERRLAKIAGASQPHMHHVLKGIREMSPGLSDRILQQFRMSVRDLWSAGSPNDGPGLPVIRDRVGPGFPFPPEVYSGEHPFAAELSLGLTHPAVFRLV